MRSPELIKHVNGAMERLLAFWTYIEPDNLLYRYVPDEDDLKVGERIRIPPQEIIDTSTEFVEEFLHNKFTFDMAIYSMEDWLETLVPVMTHIQKMVQKVAQERYMLAQKRARRERMMSYDNPDKLQ